MVLQNPTTLKSDNSQTFACTHAYTCSALCLRESSVALLIEKAKYWSSNHQHFTEPPGASRSQPVAVHYNIILLF